MSDKKDISIIDCSGDKLEIEDCDDALIITVTNFAFAGGAKVNGFILEPDEALQVRDMINLFLED